jgi:hypothetical protein
VEEDKKDHFYNLSRQMAKALRRDIIMDNGVSGLKQKVLDLITNLRLEKSILQQEAFEKKMTKRLRMEQLRQGTGLFEET